MGSLVPGSYTVLNWISSFSQQFQLPPHSFTPVDIRQFSGLWYEVARTPNYFERGCDWATAEYVLRNDPSVPYQVINTCYQKNKVTKRIAGYAKATFFPYAFSVQFPTIFTVGLMSFIPNYYVTWVSPGYQRAVIVSPLGNVWFLSRTKHVSPDDYDEMLGYVPFTPLRSRIRKNTMY